MRSVDEIFEDEVVRRINDKTAYDKAYKALNDKYNVLRKEYYTVNQTDDYATRQEAKQKLDAVQKELDEFLKAHDTKEFAIPPEVIRELQGASQQEIKVGHQNVNKEYEVLLSMLDDVAQQYKKVLEHQAQVVKCRVQVNSAVNLTTGSRVGLPNRLHYSVTNYADKGMRNTKDPRAVSALLLEQLQRLINY